MALINGDGGDNKLDGSLGADTLNGLGGNDTLDGGAGNDVLHGGDDADRLTEMTSGVDLLFGDVGDDFLMVSRNTTSSSAATLDGGDGDDDIVIQDYGGQNAFAFGGAGHDHIEIITSATVSGGADQDRISLHDVFFSGVVEVTDFETGDAGDKVDGLAKFLTVHSNWDGGDNPFSTGHLRLVQSGDATLLQVDADGGGDSFQTLFRFDHTTVGTFTAFNIEGIPLDGNPVPGTTITGDADANSLLGGFGADVISGLAGNDSLTGGGGNDSIDGGANNDTLDGGGGSDVLHGGTENDTLKDSASGSDQMFGDDGDDNLYLGHSLQANGSVTLDGGAGDDVLIVQNYGSGSSFAFGGADDDVIQLLTTATVTGGSGQDEINLHTQYEGALIEVTDFETGASADVLTGLIGFLSHHTTWDGGDNPFTTGHLRLLQSGDATLLQIDTNGGGDSFHTLVQFDQTAVADFNAANIDGIPTDGGAVLGITITGDAAANSLSGGFGSDSIFGLAGNDTLAGGGGADTLDGGADADTLNGGAGSDVLHGGTGDDHLTESTSGSDVLYGEDGDDYLYVGRSSGSGGTVTLDGGADNDTIMIQDYGGAPSSVIGGGGDDLIQILTSATITGGEGQDTISLHNLYEGALIEITDFDTGPTGDLFTGLIDFLNQHTNWDGAHNPFASGHLRLIPSGPDSLLQVDRTGGGDGFETLARFDGVALAALASIEGLPTDGSPIPGVTLTGDDTADSLVGGIGADHLSGLDGGDILIGGGEGDTLDGGSGTDTLDGGVGDDVYMADSADQITDASGIDEVRTASASYLLGAGLELLSGLASSGQALTGNTSANVITGGNGSDTLDGGAGADTLMGGGGADVYVVSAGDVVIDVGGIDEVRTSLASYVLASNLEKLTGLSSTGQTLTGNTRANTITGGGGADTLDGGVGDDSLVGGGGVDTVTYATAGKGVIVDLTFGHASGGLGADDLSQIENVIGSKKADVLIGDAAANLLAGGGGGDTLRGGAGNDALDGGGGIDTASYEDATAGVRVDLNLANAQQTGGAGADHLVAIENLTGSGFADALKGDAGVNLLTGLAGNDTLTGGVGSDVLAGGGGADTFVFLSLADSAIKHGDRIVDLTDDDIIDLKAIDADATKAGNQTFVVVDKFTHHAGELSLVFKKGATVLSLDVDGDGKADMTVQIVGEHADFTHFVL